MKKDFRKQFSCCDPNPDRIFGPKTSSCFDATEFNYGLLVLDIYFSKRDRDMKEGKRLVNLSKQTLIENFLRRDP